MQKTHFTKFFFLSITLFVVAIGLITYIVKTNVKNISMEKEEFVETQKQEESIKITEDSSPVEKPDGIEIISPEKDSQVSYVSSIIVETYGKTEISKVEFSVNKKLLSTDTKEPYNGIWDTTKESNGSHVINVKSYDKKGVMISTKSILVTVFNNKESSATKNGLPVGPQFVN